MRSVAVITAALNEAGAIDRLLEALAKQSRIPDEVVIADGGSTDGTPERVAELQSSLPFPVRILTVPGNIAVGRNAAVRACSAEIVAVTDADCVPNEDWLRELVAPIEAGEARAAAGGYIADARSPVERAIATFTWVPLQETNARFLPSHRSVAYERMLWNELGGYDVTIDTGEDTLFDLEVEKRGGFANVPRAVVSWPPRKTIPQAIRQQIRYGYGDGQARIQLRYHAVIATFVAAEITAALHIPVVRSIAAAGLLSTYTYFSYKHLRLFRTAVPDLAYVAVLTLVLPPARLAGFFSGFLSDFSSRFIRT